MKDGLSHEELVIACRNIGYDLTCGACAAVFYCGFNMPGDTHTCGRTENLNALDVRVGPADE